jgi:glycosyltransferase involved in cell wall biosynthesis
MSRILVIQQHIELLGGGAVAQKCLVDSLRGLGHEVFTLSFCGSAPADFIENHFSVATNHANQRYRRYFYDRSLIQSLQEAVGKCLPDVIFVGKVWNFVSIIAALRRSNVPVVHVVHTAEYHCLNAMLTKKDTMGVCAGGIGYKCKAHRCESWLSLIQKGSLSAAHNFLMKRYFQAFICHSPFMVRLMQEHSFRNVHYVPLNVGRHSQSLPKRSAAAGDGPIELLFVGSLAWHKGVNELIEAMRLLDKQQVSYHLKMIGEGDCRPQIEERIRKYELTDQVSLLGQVSRESLSSFYAEADIVIFPSYFESFGLVALEAMSFGKHLIVSNRGALPETTAGYPRRMVLSKISPSEIARAIIDVQSRFGQEASQQQDSGSPVHRENTSDKTMQALREILSDYCVTPRKVLVPSRASHGDPRLEQG